MLTPEYVLEVAKHTITATEYCFLMTRGIKGQVNARQCWCAVATCGC